VLGSCIARHGFVAKALREYEAQRMPRVKQIMDLSMVSDGPTHHLLLPHGAGMKVMSLQCWFHCLCVSMPMFLCADDWACILPTDRWPGRIKRHPKRRPGESRFPL
jgi:hypothetical protein